jgi:hypothetical protein
MRDRLSAAYYVRFSPPISVATMMADYKKLFGFVTPPPLTSNLNLCMK